MVAEGKDNADWTNITITCLNWKWDISLVFKANFTRTGHMIAGHYKSLKTCRPIMNINRKKSSDRWYTG